MLDELAIIQNEIGQITKILSALVGTADRSVDIPFSEEIRNKVAKDFLKLSIERGEQFGKLILTSRLWSRMASLYSLARFVNYYWYEKDYAGG